MGNAIIDPIHGGGGDASISGGHLEKLHHEMRVILQLHPGQFEIIALVRFGFRAEDLLQILG